jgi:integrase/recombinase XerD
MTGAFHGRGRSPERICLKRAQWPARDRLLWAEALRPGDLLEPGGIRAKYRKVSNDKIEKGYGRYLTWLQHRGELDPNTAPGSRINPNRVASYVEDLEKLGNKTHTILARLQELYEAAQVMDPIKDWTWIRRVAGIVRARPKITRDKKHKMVGTEDLFGLGLELMERARAEPNLPRAALIFRDGLIIAFVALRPFRLRNLAEVELDRTLRRNGDVWSLAFPDGDGTKSGAPIEVPWPEILIPALEEWLDYWRPQLMDRPHDGICPIGGMLWVSQRRTPMTKAALYSQIVMRTRVAFGTPINPHLFRDCAATTLAQVDPEHVRIAAPLLTHRTFSTTERYYIRANTIAACREYQKAIRRRRRERLLDPDPETR